MISYNVFIEEVLKRLCPDMPVLIERGDHKIEPIKLRSQNLTPELGYGFHRILDKSKLLDFVQEDFDEELFPEDMWKDEGISKMTYARDWAIDTFDYPTSIWVSEGAEFKDLAEYNIKKNDNIIAFISNSVTGIGTVQEFLEQYRREQGSVHKLFPIFFHFDDQGVYFFATHLKGIGLNKKDIVCEDRHIERGKAVIINLNLQMKNNGKDETCDFSLYRNFSRNPWPKKYSRDLYNCLIYERRKIHEKA